MKLNKDQRLNMCRTQRWLWGSIRPHLLMNHKSWKITSWCDVTGLLVTSWWSFPYYIIRLSLTKVGLYLSLSNSLPLITARKRSLGQGNAFSNVSHSVHSGGSAYRGGGSAHRGQGWADPPPQESEKLAVRILLECFLVFRWISWHSFVTSQKILNHIKITNPYLNLLTRI